MGGVLGCGSDKDARRTEGGPELAMNRRAPAHRPADAAAPTMTITNELGVMDTDDVEATIADHFDDVRGCYGRAGKAQRYAGGRVLLRFMVNADGSAQDVRVLETTLGNYDVERCLVEVGRKIRFHAPSGAKPTTFEYPVEFRSTNEVGVLDVDGPKVDRDVAAFLPQLAACGQLASGGASAVVYVGPNGFPGSVGLATPAALDEDVGECVVETIRGWKMSVGLPRHVVRASFHIPPMIATADATRRRHRHRWR
jgi:TonB family protein